MDGFVHLSMSEPMRNHGFSRLAWVNFATEHQCEQALEMIPSISVDDFTLNAAKSHPNKKRIPVRIAPPLPQRALQTDFDLCKELITQVFDPEKGIETKVVAAVEEAEIEHLDEAGNSTMQKLPLQLKLDILLLYLRRVHAFCFYCSEEYEDERMLSTRCGPQHIRHHQAVPDEEFDEILKKSLEETGEVRGDGENPD